MVHDPQDYDNVTKGLQSWAVYWPMIRPNPVGDASAKLIYPPPCQLSTKYRIINLIYIVQQQTSTVSFDPIFY